MSESLSSIDTGKLKYPAEIEVVATETSTSDTKNEKVDAKKSSAVTTPLFTAKADEVKPVEAKVIEKSDATLFETSKETPVSKEGATIGSCLAGDHDVSSAYGDALQLGEHTKTDVKTKKRDIKSSMRKKLARMRQEKSLRFSGSKAYASSKIEPQQDEFQIDEATEAKLGELFDQYEKDVAKVGVKKAEKTLIRNIRQNISKPEMRKKFTKYIKENGADREKFEAEFKKASDLQTFARECILEDENTSQKEKEEIVEAATEDIPEAQQEYLELVEEVMPENITKEKAEELFSSVNEYSMAQRDDIILHVAMDGSYSEDFQSKIIRDCAKVHTDTTKRTKEFIKRFWETPKGRAIISYTKHVMENIQDLKEDLAEKKDEVKEKIIESEEAQKAYEIAQEKVKKAKKKAESIIEELGLKDLRPDIMKKILKHKSPKAYRRLEEAEYKQKQADWAAFEADIAKKNAIFDAINIARNIAVAQAKAKALIHMMGSCFGG